MDRDGISMIFDWCRLIFFESGNMKMCGKNTEGVKKNGKMRILKFLEFSRIFQNLKKKFFQIFSRFQDFFGSSEKFKNPHFPAKKLKRRNGKKS